MALQEQTIKMEKVAAAVGLSINGEKTQLLLLGASRHYEHNPVLEVDGHQVAPSPSITLLGMELDGNLSTNGYTDAMIKETKRWLGMLRLLAPRLSAAQLRMIVMGLLIGKAQTYTCIGHCHHIRLSNTDPIPERTKKLQVILNDSARMILGVRRSDHVEVGTLLKDSGIPSVNSLVAREAAMTAWHALATPHAQVTPQPDGMPLRQSPLAHIFDDLRMDERTRGAGNTALRPPLCPELGECLGGKRHKDVEWLWSSAKCQDTGRGKSCSAEDNNTKTAHIATILARSYKASLGTTINKILMDFAK